jgi:hypothetical protein
MRVPRWLSGVVAVALQGYPREGSLARIFAETPPGYEGLLALPATQDKLIRRYT